MWYLVCFSTSLSPSVNDVLCSTNTCHPTSLDPCETTKHSYQKGISSKPLPMTPIMTAIAQRRPVPWTGRRLVPSTGPDLTLNRSHLNRSHLNRSHLGGVHVPVGPVYGTNCLHKRLPKKLTLRVCGVRFTCFDSCKHETRRFSKKRHFLRQTASSTYADVQ